MATASQVVSKPAVRASLASLSLFGPILTALDLLTCDGVGLGALRPYQGCLQRAEHRTVSARYGRPIVDDVPVLARVKYEELGRIRKPDGSSLCRWFLTG